MDGIKINLNSCRLAAVFSALFFLHSCNKVDIAFETTATALDPNITYYDNYAVDIATYKPDSFITSGHSVLVAGYHADTALGVIKAGTYMQIAFPSTNPLLNANAVFDSLELLLQSSGQFYGDSTKPITVKVFQLTQNIINEAGDTYYNTSSFPYATTTIAQKTLLFSNKTGIAVGIRLSDAVGQDWFNKFKTGNDTVSSAEKFIDYFKGIYITSDSVQTKTVTYFNAPADTPVLRLHYHELGLFAEKKQFDFTYTSAKQFNNLNFRFTNAAFTPLNAIQSRILRSTESNNQSVLNTAFGGVVKISFSGLLNLKEKHPYVKVVKALLVIKPDVKTTIQTYTLPASLNLYTTDDTNLLIAGIFETTTTGTVLQTGNLVIDYVYGEGTQYTYDITSFINTKISEGEFSKSALLLSSTLSNYDAGIQRLIINNQKGSRPIQLQLFVLGL